MAVVNELRTFSVYRRPGSKWFRGNSRDESTTLHILGYPRGLVPTVSLFQLADNLGRHNRHDLLIVRQYGHAQLVIDLRTSKVAAL